MKLPSKYDCPKYLTRSFTIDHQDENEGGQRIINPLQTDDSGDMEVPEELPEADETTE